MVYFFGVPVDAGFCLIVVGGLLCVLAIVWSVHYE